MTRQQNFFGRVIAATDLAILCLSYLAAYSVRLNLWLLGYPVMPIGGLRASAWILTIVFPAWLIAHRHFNLYSPATYRTISSVFGPAVKAQVVASVLMLNAVFIIRGWSGVSRPLLALVIMFNSISILTEKLALVFVMRYRWRLQRRSTVWRVLLVGSRADAENYLEVVREHPEWNLKIVDVVAASSAGTAVRTDSGNLHSTTER